MIPPPELPLLLAAARDGLLDPARVAAGLAGWNPAAWPRLADYLADRGLLDPDALRRLTAALADASTPAGGDADVLAGPVDETATAAGPCGPGTPRPGGLPDVGPRYRLLRRHGNGGLGEVWLGLDTVLGRQVAVKVLRADRTGQPALDRRFTVEGLATARLEHPSIVPVYDLLPADPRRRRDAAVVMRFVPGRTLADAARGYVAAPHGPAGRAALRPLLEAFVRVCQAVAFAHAQGVLHRDLKGANVILGDYGEVQLLDWGLAKPVTAAVPAGPRPPVVAPGDSGLTAPGGVVGTPAYVSPEVAGGYPATERADVYGLGATLYAVLTGRPPYDDPDPQAVLDQVRRDGPPPPRAVNPAAPAALNAVVLKAMSRDPAGRYGSADALAADVQAWLGDRPVIAHPDGPAAVAARWTRHHQRAVVLAASVLAVAGLGLIGGTAAVAREGQRTELQRQLAEGRLAAFRDHSDHLLVVAEPELYAVPGSERARLKLLSAAIKAGAAFQDDPDAAHRLARLHTCRANLHRRVLHGSEADADFVAAVDLLRSLPWALAARQLAETQADQAVCDAARGRPQRPGPVVSSSEPYPAYRQAQAAVLRQDWATARTAAAEAVTRLRRDDSADRGYGWFFFVHAHVLGATAERRSGRPADALDRLDEVSQAVGRPGDGVCEADAVSARGEWLLERARCLANVSDRTDEAVATASHARTVFDALRERNPTAGGSRLRAVEARLLLAQFRATAGDQAAADGLFAEAARLLGPLVETAADWVDVDRVRREVATGLAENARLMNRGW